MATLSAMESAARDMIELSRVADVNDADCNWQVRQAIRIAFTACWSSEMGAERIAAIAAILAHIICTDDWSSAVTAELDAMSAGRGRLLYRRTVCGVRYYGLNFKKDQPL